MNLYRYEKKKQFIDRVAELDLPTGFVKYNSTFTAETTSTQVPKSNKNS